MHGDERRRFLAIGLASLAASLPGCGGGGGGGEDGRRSASAGSTPSASDALSGEVEAPVPPVPASELFIGDISHEAIGCFAAFDTSRPSFAEPNATLAVSNLRDSLAYDSAHDVLYALGASSLLVYANASMLETDAAPSRVLPLPSDWVWGTAVAVDATRDELYVAGARRYDGQLLVIQGASASANLLSSARVMTMEAVNAMALDASRSILYVTTATQGVHVFTGIDTATGPVTAARHMLQFHAGGGIAVDATRDRLYVADAFVGVRMMDAASTASQIDRGVLVLPDPRVVAVDPGRDRLYVGAYDRVYVLDHASSLAPGSSVPAAALLGRTGSSFGGFAFRQVPPGPGKPIP